MAGWRGIAHLRRAHHWRVCDRRVRQSKICRACPDLRQLSAAHAERHRGGHVRTVLRVARLAARAYTRAPGSCPDRPELPGVHWHHLYGASPRPQRHRDHVPSRAVRAAPLARAGRRQHGRGQHAAGRRSRRPRPAHAARLLLGPEWLLAARNGSAPVPVAWPARDTPHAVRWLRRRRGGHPVLCADAAGLRDGRRCAYRSGPKGAPGSISAGARLPRDRPG
mmetsp:Transcript_350/g.1125  ORF Transcript_350/g.1125 Transcript_350/m.1125 type:complete len:222 (-) Transcript_350:208-873(-)